MARQKSNAVMAFTSGRIGKLLVFKNYSGNTVISKYPNMSKVKRSAKQKDENSLFSRAVRFYKRLQFDPSLLQDPDFAVKEGQSYYHAVISWYLRKHREQS